jgi:hypothetical protein
VNFAQANSNNNKDTGGFLKIAHTKKKILVQIFEPKIQAQN